MWIFQLKSKKRKDTSTPVGDAKYDPETEDVEKAKNS
jgi:hypothetical protein